MQLKLTQNTSGVAATTIATFSSMNTDDPHARPSGATPVSRGARRFWDAEIRQTYNKYHPDDGRCLRIEDLIGDVCH